MPPLASSSPRTLRRPHRQHPVLLGQIVIFGRSDVDLSSLFDNHMDSLPFCWSDSDVEPPLLSSTKHVLDLLQLHLPRRDGVKKTPVEEEHSGGTEETAGIVTDDDDLGEVEESIDNEETEGFAELQRLQRVLNLGDKLVKALRDIRSMKLEHVAKSKQPNGSANGKRYGKRDDHQARVLEKQRDLLQKRQQEEMNSDRDVLDNETEDEEEFVDADSKQVEPAAREPAVVEPAAMEPAATERVSAEVSLLTLSKTINSLSALTPFLLRMWQHPQRTNKQIKIGGVSIRNKKNKGAKSWLLFDNVFDSVTNKQLTSIMDELSGVYLLLGLTRTEWEREESRSEICDSLIRRCVAYVQIDGKDIDGGISWLGLSPLSSFDNQEQVREKAASLDIILNLDRSEEEIQRRKQYEACIKRLSQLLEDLLKKKFKGSRLSVYGSCLSDLSLGKSADVDVSLFIPQMADERERFEAGTLAVKSYQQGVKQRVYQTCRLLENRTGDFCNMNPVARARVPVVKGTYKKAENPYTDDGSIEFDVCFLNDIAVSNSELLRQYSLVDPRVKKLMITVKRWAKAQKISSTMNNCLSSYTWMNLTIFYLQCLGFVPNLQCPQLCKKVEVGRDKSNEWHRVQNLDTFFLTWEQARLGWELPQEHQELSLVSLLYGFFSFYTKDFPTAFYIISIKRGADCHTLKLRAFPKSDFFYAIEDPFETFDSHKPHQLGMHASTTGQELIVNCMHNAADGLQRLLTSDESVDTNFDFLFSSHDGVGKEMENNKKRGATKANSKMNKQQQQPKAKSMQKGVPQTVETKAKNKNSKVRKAIKDSPANIESATESGVVASGKSDPEKTGGAKVASGKSDPEKTGGAKSSTNKRKPRQRARNRAGKSKTESVGEAA